MKIQVKNLGNEAVRELELAPAIFEYPYNEHLIHAAVVAVRAAARRGTHQVKGRGEVRGSTRKPWRQKGTGRARAGSIRSPLWRTGGVVHGPQHRSHATRMSAGEKKNALKSALSRKLADGDVVVLDSWELESHKTAELAATLEELGVGKALLIDGQENRNLTLAARNNPALKVVDVEAVNVYDVVDRECLVISEQALERLAEVLAS